MPQPDLLFDNAKAQGLSGLACISIAYACNSKVAPTNSGAVHALARFALVLGVTLRRVRRLRIQAAII
jgi:hypothetical protein